MIRRSQLATLFGSFALAASFLTAADRVGADPYIRDDVNDTGIEPNPSNGPMYLSPDIFVRNDPLPGWNPYPYPVANPPAWMNPAPAHQDPDYRSPRSGRPNYIYVRIRNKGSATTGTERLLVYWASASSGLSWDPNKVAGSFIDNVQNNILFGQEITKPRKNAANASPTERTAYVNAILKLASDPSLVFGNGGESYWRTQQAIHRFGPPSRHHTVDFLPWHREFINRYEGLLQEADPTVKLLYWNWHDNPATGPLNYFTTGMNGFMGASGQGQAQGSVIGLPLSPTTDSSYSNWVTGSVPVIRRFPGGASPVETDTTVVNRADFDNGSQQSSFAYQLERSNHDYAHPYIGGSWAANTQGGDMTYVPLSTRDPFFFLLHTKVDELWARWQRKSLTDLDPATTFGTATGDANIAQSMGPWDGTVTPDAHQPPVGQYIEPWSPVGGEIYSKQGDDRSVVSPPIYDTALLTIPVLQPNEEVVMEIPWYPPNPAGFGNINDPEHVCLYARIETSTSFPYGMTMPETNDINFDTKQNNNIAWRNVHIVDSFPGPFKIVHFLLHNIAREPLAAGLMLGAVVDPKDAGFAKEGSVRIDLGKELFERWRAANKGDVRGLEVLPGGILRMTAPRVALKGLALRPGETFPVRLGFDLNRDYRPTAKGEPIAFDVVQTGLPGKPDAVVGGNRYAIDLEKLTFVKQGDTWRWLPGFKPAPEGWMGTGFEDSRWYQRRLELGLDDMLGAGRERPVTTYFRRSFTLDDPSILRSLTMRVARADGAIVYVNGKEVYRSGLPEGRVDYRTFARTGITGVERDAFFLVKLDPGLLQRGVNVVAAEVHRAERGAADPAFDLELDANWERPLEPPAVAFLNVPDGALAHAGGKVTVDVDALGTSGEIKRVELSVDGRTVQALEKPPFRFELAAGEGPHRLSVAAVDGAGQRSTAFGTLTGVKNLPPVVSLVQPGRQAEVMEGSSLTLTAEARDPDGEIASVDFYIDDRERFTDPDRLVGTVKSPPYTITLKDLKPGGFMVFAVAHDNRGAETTSVPQMVMVMGRGRR